MKKGFITLFLAFASLCLHAQAGDLYVGLQGGYTTYYKAPLYGLNVSYDVANPLQISLTGLMNSNFTKPSEISSTMKEKWSIYSANLDARLFLINMESWATGPSLGGQYMRYSFLDDSNYSSSGNLLGFNIGWHIKINITDNVRVNGGWRYSSMKESSSYSLFYIGIGYSFNLF